MSCLDELPLLRGHDNPVCPQSLLRALLPGVGRVAGEHAAARVVRHGDTDAEAGRRVSALVAKRERRLRSARPADRQATGAAMGRQPLSRWIGRIRRASLGAGRIVTIGAERPDGPRRRGRCIRGRWFGAGAATRGHRGHGEAQDQNGKSNLTSSIVRIVHRTRGGEDPETVAPRSPASWGKNWAAPTHSQ